MSADPAPIAASPRTGGPRLWVQRFVLLRSLQPFEILSPERDRRLHPGLNIVWGESGGVLLGGHSVGKTLFCKLLRFGLGEESYDDEAFMRRVEKQLPGAYLGMEVVVGGSVWSVLRPLCREYKPKGKRDLRRRSDGALKGGTVEQAGAELLDPAAFEAYLKALEDLKDKCLSKGFSPGDPRPFRWPELLQWFARDQETRFQDHTIFRSRKSRTTNPIEGARSDLLVRTALGLVDAEETRIANALRDVRKRLEEANSKNKAVEKLLRAGALMMSALHEGTSTPPETIQALEDEGDLFFIPAQIAEQMKAAEDELKIAQAEHGILDKAVVVAFEAFSECQDTVLAYEALFGTQEEVVDHLEGKMAALQRTLERRYRKATERCPDCLELYGETKTTARLEAFWKELASAAPERRRQMEAELEKEREGQALQIREATERRDAAKEIYDDALAARAAKAKQMHDLGVTISVAERKLREAEAYVKGAAEAKAGSAAKSSPLHLVETEAARKEAKQLSERLSEIRAGKLSQLEGVREAFRGVVRACLGETFDGRIVEQDGHLKFQLVTGRGQQGEAVETLTVILADLCTMKMAIDGSTSLPGLLVHDSPREADLDQEAYAKLFKYVEVLSDKSSLGGSIPFQYIITTTTPPPDRYRDEASNEVVLKLSAAQGEKGLLLQCPIGGSDDSFAMEDSHAS